MAGGAVARIVLPASVQGEQAVGVLIGGGLTEDEALAELDARASAIGVERHLAAAKILACLPGDSVDRAQDSSQRPVLR